MTLTAGTYDGTYLGVGDIVITAVSPDPSRNTLLTIDIDGGTSTVATWSASPLTVTGATVNGARAVAFGEGSATVTLNGTPTGIDFINGTLTADDGVKVVTVPFSLNVFVQQMPVAARFTRDTDGDGSLDAIELQYPGALNDDLTGFAATVQGRTVTGVDTGATPNDNTLVIRLQPLPTTDTDATPQVAVTASPALQDVTNTVGTIADAGPVAPVDGASPVLVDASASDGTVPGSGIDSGDSVTLTFSEIIAFATVTPANINSTFTLASGTWLDGAGGFGGATFLVDALTITLTTNGAPPTIAIGNVITMAGTLIEDLLGNPAIGAATLLGSFGPSLDLLARRTRDGDANGFIDAIELEYFLPLNDDFSGFTATVSTYTVLSVDTGTTPNDALVRIVIQEKTMADTGVRPDVQVTSAPNLRDSTGTLAPAPDLTPVQATDGAAPVLRTAQATDGSTPAPGIDAGDNVICTFSESIAPAALTASNVNVALVLSNGHSWLDGSGAFGGASFVGQQVTCQLSVNTSPPTVAVSDTITVSGTLLQDSTGNAAVGVATIGGSFEPDLVIVARRTRDRDANGRIDAIELEFNFALNDNLTGASADVTGYGNEAVATGATANDSFLLVTFDEGPVPDTGATPDVNLIAAPSLMDVTSTFSVNPGQLGTGITPIDGAPPVLLSAVASDGAIPILGPDDDDTVTCNFSETLAAVLLDDTTINATLALSSGHSWLDGAGQVDGAVNVGAAVVVDLSDNTSPPTVSLGDTITVAGALIADPEGNAALGTALINGTFSPPVAILSRFTRDTNSDGRLDAIDVRYALPLNDNFTGFAATTTTPGYTVGVVSTGTTAGDDFIRIALTGPGGFDTAVTPNLQITASPQLRDSTQQAVCLTDSSPITPSDGAGPALISAIADDGSIPIVGPDDDDSVTLTFSEPLQSVTLNAGNINTALALSGGHSWLDGAGTFGGATFSTNTIVCNLNATVTPPTIALGDTITPGGGIIIDLAANVATASAALGGTFSAPFGTLSRATRDTNGNGRIDAIEITYAQPLNDNFSGYVATVTGFAVLSVTTGAVANDAVVRINVREFAAPDTSALPTSQITAAPQLRDVTNQAGTLTDPSPVTPTDGARPVLVGATASDGTTLVPGIDVGDTVTLTFSEPMLTTALSSALLDSALALSSGHTWLDEAGGAGAITWTDSRTLRVTLTRTNGPPTVTVGDSIDPNGITLIEAASSSQTCDDVPAGFAIDGSFGNPREVGFIASRVPLPEPQTRVALAATEDGGAAYLAGVFSGSASTAFRYDPQDSNFVPLPPIPGGGRAGAAAAVVAGKLYLVGGPNTTTPVFDPATYTWSTAAALPTTSADGNAVRIGPRLFFTGGSGGSHTQFLDFATTSPTWQAASTPTSDFRLGAAAAFGARLFYFGGRNGGGAPQAASFVYAPSTNLWSNIAPLPVPLRAARAVSDGDLIWIIGGEVAASTPTDLVFAYDPVANAYHQPVRLPAARTAVAAAAVAGGVYVMGGNDGAGTPTDRVLTLYGNGLPSHPVLAPTTGGAARRDHLLLANGDALYVVGGHDGTTRQSAVLRFALATQSWSSVAALPSALEQAAGVSQGGRLYTFGGVNNSGPTAAIYRFDVSAGTWTTLGNLPAARSGARAVDVGGTIYLLGGLVTGSSINAVDTFEPGSLTLSTAPADMTGARERFAAAALGTSIYIAGGYGSGGTPLSTAQVYDTVGDAWSALPALPEPRGGCAGVAIRGEFWVLGGEGSGATESALVFNPALGEWRKVSALPGVLFKLAAARAGDTAYIYGGDDGSTIRNQLRGISRAIERDASTTAVPAATHDHATVALDRQLYVIGGRSGGAAVSTVRRLDGGTWTTLPALSGARGGVAAAVFEGKVYACGGGTSEGAPSQTVEIYNSISNNWVAGPNLPQARYGACAAAAGSALYVIGGLNSSGTPQSTVYRLTGTTWTQVASLNVARAFAGCAVIGGRIYIAGGQGAETSVECFDPAAGAWFQVATLTRGHDGPAVAAIDGKLHVIGGRASGTRHNSVDVFDPITGSVTRGRRHPLSLDRACAATIGHRIVAVGGRTATSPNGVNTTTEIAPTRRVFDADVPPEYWRTVGPALPRDHVQGRLAAVGNNVVLLGGAGGFSGADTATTYDTLARTFTSHTATMPWNARAAGVAVNGTDIHVVAGDQTNNHARFNTLSSTFTSTLQPTFQPAAAATRLGLAASVANDGTDDYLYAVGGFDGATATATVYRYDFGGDTWSLVAPLPSARQRGALAVIHGQLYYIGGLDGGGAATATVFVYDPVADAWKSGIVPNIPTAQSRGGLVRFLDTMMLVGGRNGTSTDLKSSAIYSPLDGWIATADVLQAAQFAGGVAMTANGRLYRLPDASAVSGAAYLEEYVPPTATRVTDLRRRWLAGSQLSAPTARAYAATAFTGSEVLVWGGENGGGPLDTGGAYDPISDSWRALPTSNAPTARLLASHCWTGRYWLVWGGHNGGPGGSGFQDTGKRYDAATNQWLNLDSSNDPSSRVGTPMLWTGRYALIWGGLRNNGAVNDGRRYDPYQDTWTDITAGGAPSARCRHVAVWTGSRMIVWGGEDGAGTLRNNGAQYDPIGDQWSGVQTTGAPTARADMLYCWTGTELLVFGGVTNIGVGTLTNTGFRYNPVSNTWTPMTTTNAPPAMKAPSHPSRNVTHDPVAHWDGREMLITTYVTTSGDTPDPGPCWAYNPTTNTWRSFARPTQEQGAGQSQVMTDREILMFGGQGATAYTTLMRRYSIGRAPTDKWTATAASGAPSAREGHAAVWAQPAQRVVIWGGDNGGGTVSTGARFDPATNTWIALGGSVPAPRRDAVAVYTGRDMFVGFGAENGATFPDSHSRYNATENQWQSANSSSMTGRTDAAACWTNHYVFVWGGRDVGGTLLADGGRYDPVSDAWSGVNASGAPTARADTACVFTGTEVIVFGGTTGGGATNTGFRYNPEANAWTPMSTANAPALANMMYGWTRRYLVVFGDDGAGNAIGARYDVQTDTWTPISLVGAPAARFTASQHDHGVYDPITDEFIVFQGDDGAGNPTGGAAYHVGSDSWRTLSASGAPAARLAGSDLHLGGGRSLTWGGDDGGGPTDGGARYD